MSVDSGGAQADAVATGPSISADGRFVAFRSNASNLIPGDLNGVRDIFVRDRQLGITERVSVNTNGTESDAPSIYSTISLDGRYVAFVSLATNLVSGDTNGFYDVFVRDRQSGTTERVSIGSGGAEGNGASELPSISADGRFVTFYSGATNFVPGDTNARGDVFRRDRQTGSTERISVDSSGTEGNEVSVRSSISADGRYIAFESAATNLVPADTNGRYDVFIRDCQAATTTRVSLGSGGVGGDDQSYLPVISPDGRFVAFASVASNLVAGQVNGTQNIYLRDLGLGVTTLVSVNLAGLPSGSTNYDPSISADGRFIAFASTEQNLVPADSNLSSDIFLHDRVIGVTARVSVSSSGGQGNNNSGNDSGPSISANGRCIAFDSLATNLVSGDTNGLEDVFVRDRGAQSAFSHFCFGDGSGAFCPCANSGGIARGCQNSAGTGGALLTVSGSASLSADTVQFISAGERTTALSIVLQGDTAIAPVNYGDGLRCTGGDLKRLYVKTAVGGVVFAPQGSDLSISTRSAAMGALIPLGATRVYQVYYRDGNPSFCPAPTGSSFNVSNAIAVAWGD